MEIKEIKFKRGTQAKVSVHVGLTGEPMVATDTKEVFIGDGVNAGGFPVGTVKSSDTSVAGQLASFKDTSGRLLEPVDASTITSGFAKEDWVTNQITTTVPGIKVTDAASSDSSKDSQKLGGRASTDYLTTDVLTDSYTEADSAKVTSAKGVKDLHDTLKASTDSLENGKIDKTSISSLLSSTSTTTVASSGAIKLVNDKATTALSTANSAKVSAQTATTDAASAKVTANSALTEANKATVLATDSKNIADAAKAAADAHTAQLAKLPGQIFKSSAAPTGGSDGDVWLQY